MAPKSGPRPKAPRRRKPAQEPNKLTTGELVAALKGESTLPPEKIEQAMAGVQVDAATVERAFVERITPDGQHHGSPLALRVHDAVDNKAVKPAILAPASIAQRSASENGCNLLAQVFSYWKQRAFKVRDFLATCPTKEVELPALEIVGTSWHEMADHLTGNVILVAIHAAHHVDEPNPFCGPTDWAGVVSRAQEKPDRYWPAIAKALCGVNLTEHEANKLERFVDLEWDAMNVAESGQGAVRSLIRDGCRHAIYILLAAQATKDARSLETISPVDLRGERFAQLHRRFMDGSPRCPYLRYIAATGHNNCPGWPNVPASLTHDTLELAHKDWLDVTNKRPGTFFVGLNDQWLKVDGQFWHGSFYFDGPIANPYDHDELQRQNADIHKAINEFELLASEAAGFLGRIPWTHALVESPRKPQQSHRWLEAVCASVEVEPAGYHCFDVRRVPGNIFQASAILLENMKTAADEADVITRPLAPLNVNECDLRPVLAAAEAFLAECRKADERAKFDDGGAIHILFIARQRLSEALAPFKHTGGLTGDDEMVGAINALLQIANDAQADSRVERVEAVIAFLRKAIGQNDEVATARLERQMAIAWQKQPETAQEFSDWCRGCADVLRPIVVLEPAAAYDRAGYFANESVRKGRTYANLLGLSDAAEAFGEFRERSVDDAFHRLCAAARYAAVDSTFAAPRERLSTANEVPLSSIDEPAPGVDESPLLKAGANEVGTTKPPLPPAGYLGLRVDDDRRTIARDGYTAVVNLQDSPIKWAIFKKLAENRDVPVAPEAIIGLWEKHGVARKPSDGTVNDAVGELRTSLKTIELTIVVKRKVGRLLAELPPPADKTKRCRPKKKK